MTTYENDKDLLHQAKDKVSHAWDHTKDGLVKAAEIVVEVAGDFKDEAKKAIVGVEEPEPERRKVSFSNLPPEGPPNVISQSARRSMENEARYCL
ncbi:hypothetical protein AAVH_28754 [Aphelenchoides avenae]|nr:hypothetical protein AAVH_28754 [Aphelenchus avenae]